MKKYFWRNFILIFSVAVITLIIQNGILFIQYNYSQDDWKKDAFNDFLNVADTDIEYDASQGTTDIDVLYEFIDSYDAARISSYTIMDSEGNSIMQIRKEPGESMDLRPPVIPDGEKPLDEKSTELPSKPEGTEGVPALPDSGTGSLFSQEPPEMPAFEQDNGDFVGEIELSVNGTPYSVNLYAYNPRTFEYTKDIINSCLRSILFSIPVCLLIAVIISYFISRNNTISVNSVRKALGELRKGRHGVKVEKASKSELKEIAEDIEALDEKLEADERGRKAWLTSISHDLNTPATGIKLLADGLADGVFPPDKETLESLRHESDSLNERISRVVDYSTLQSAKLVLGRMTCREFAEKIGFENQDLGEFRTEFTEGDIIADLPLMERLCRELLKNATDYGCNVVLKVSSAEDKNIIEVSNTGKLPDGITSENAFELWNRGDQSRHSGGTGLGLPVVGTIARLHGGSASIKQSGESLVVAEVSWKL